MADSERSRIIVWLALGLGALESAGAFLYSVFGAGIYGSPFGKGGMPIEQELGIVLLMLTGPLWLLFAGLVARFFDRHTGARTMLAGGVLSMASSLYLASVLLWESEHWWEVALGFELEYFLGLTVLFSIPMFVLGFLLQKSIRPQGTITRSKWTFLGAGLISFCVLVYLGFSLTKPFRQQMAKWEIEAWGGSVLIARERIQDDSLTPATDMSYHKPDFYQYVHVHLSKTDVRDEDLVVLHRLGNVTHVNLSDTEVGDRGISYLSEFSGMESLNLLNTPVTDDGLESLRPLTSMTFLNLYGTQTTKEGRDKLRTALPNCVISPNDNSVVRSKKSDKDWCTRYLVTVRERAPDRNQGKMVPGAQVTFDDEESGTSFQKSESRTGYYSFELPVGTYRLTVSCDGYRPYVHEKPVKVNVRGGRVSIDVELDRRLEGSADE